MMNPYGAVGVPELIFYGLAVLVLIACWVSHQVGKRRQAAEDKAAGRGGNP